MEQTYIAVTGFTLVGQSGHRASGPSRAATRLIAAAQSLNGTLRILLSKHTQPDKIRDAFNAQFCHHACFVHLHSTRADTQSFGNLAIVFSDNDQIHDFPLSRGQVRKQTIRLGIPNLLILGSRLANKCLSYRAHQFGVINRFLNKIHGMCTKGLSCRFHIAMSGHHNYWQSASSL